MFNGRIDIGAFEYQQASDLNLLVDTLVDENDGNYGRGDLSLREAIALANQWHSTDTIRLDPSLTSSGPATIRLNGGELRISDSVSIIGPGRDLLTVDASGNDSTPGLVDGRGSRIFNVSRTTATPANVLISNLRLTGGDMHGHGGAITSSESLLLKDMLIDNNAATGLGSGGGVYVTPQAGELVRIENSIITGNLAHRYGGGIGIAYSQGDVEIYNSTISNNGSFVSAGGVSLYSLAQVKAWLLLDRPYRTITRLSTAAAFESYVVT